MGDDMSAISSADNRERKHVEIEGATMAYVDTGGKGPTVVFLHGNPTSSYLWRNVISEVEGSARCLAPDLIGMGDSDANPSGSYRFVDHRRFLDGWFDTVLPAGQVYLVIHDWGSALGFDWANRHRDRVAGIVYMEAIVTPIESWEHWPESARGIFQGMRSDAGESIVIEKNVFVERILPASVKRKLTDQEMAVYNKRFKDDKAARWPTLTWPREIPIEGQPADVAEIVADYAAWLASEVSPPKVFVNADPGTILIGPQREVCRSWPNQTEVTVAGLHFIQEDSPVEIGQAVVGLLRD
jgi:haloalkane dehalogenase